ncbi:MAG: ABC transporter ATP-binding protein [Clostridia bacterium]|nr:ABC transporter ATP-binding protein [Clostridia bacterium]
MLLEDLPDSIVSIIFSDITVDSNIISSKDQYEFLKVFSTIDKDADSTLLYQKVEQMPDSIKEFIKPFMDIEKVKEIAIFLLILYVISGVFMYIQSIIMTLVSNKFANRLRKNISQKINRLELKYFDRHQSGDILSRVTNDVDTVAQSMNQALATLVSNLTLFLGSIVMMFYTNYIMALTAIFASIFGFAFMGILLKKSQGYFTARQKELGELNAHIEEIYSGLNVVKVYNGKKKADEEFDKLNEKLCYSNRKSQFISGIMHPMMGFIGNFGYVAVCIVGALLASKGSITFGVIVAFITYVRLFTNPLSQIAQSMTSIQQATASSERVFEFLDENEMTDEKTVTKSLDKTKVKGCVEFKNVIFKYDDSEKEAIKGFTAKAKSGQKIAIVGPTGAGKTTMVNLLMKFYDIASGEILIDGVSTKELSRENVHSLFTMVLQDTWLFEGTLKENIAYNRENVSDEEVLEVLRAVGLEHFVKTLPDGINTMFSENDSVSTGQRQLITIARGMIESAPLLILDEATSNVDTRTEELVQKAMDKLSENRTSFIIAHRLSTIKNADLILVMNEGNIIEQGNHDSLMKQNGFYAKLYNSQFEM